MPTYDYVCDACGHAFELFQSITADPEKTCPECRKRKLRRLIGMGAAILVGGSGGGRDAESSETSSSTDESSTSDKTSDADGSKKKTSDDASTNPPEKKISGSTSTPTHEAREGRGVGNLVDAARRQRKADQKQKTDGGASAKPAKATKPSGTKKKAPARKTASPSKSTKPTASRKKK